MSANPFGQRNEGGRCTCSECGRTFGGSRAFDLHRINATGEAGYDADYDWRCATDAELADRGLHQNAKSWWVRALEGSFRSPAKHREPSGMGSEGAIP